MVKMFGIGLIVGLVLGACGGLFVAALCLAASDTDERRDEWNS